MTVYGLGKRPKNHGPSHDTGKTSRIKTATANIRSEPEMKQERVRADVKKVLKSGADIIGWQEMEPDRYIAALKDLGKKGWDHFIPKHGKNEVALPISWKKDKFEFLGGGMEQTTDGRAGISPNRYITWAKLRDKKSGEEIVQINTHLISGAWNPAKAHRPSTPWRREQWNKHMKELDGLVAKFEKQGKKVIINGDFNRDSYKVLGNDVTYGNKLNVGTHGKSTLDYIMHTRNKELQGGRVEYLRKLFTDHDPMVKTFKLK